MSAPPTATCRGGGAGGTTAERPAPAGAASPLLAGAPAPGTYRKWPGKPGGVFSLLLDRLAVGELTEGLPSSAEAEAGGDVVDRSGLP